jgi:hypothetical protein
MQKPPATQGRASGTCWLRSFQGSSRGSTVRRVWDVISVYAFAQAVQQLLAHVVRGADDRGIGGGCRISACAGRLAGVPLSSPSTLMSSSTSGQCTPWPSPMISQRARCSGVASERRQDHSSGTLTVRPSDRWATMSLSVTLTDRMCASVWVTVLIPSFLDPGQVQLDQLRNPPQFSLGETMFLASSTGSSQNLHTILSRCARTCIGSLQSKL